MLKKTIHRADYKKLTRQLAGLRTKNQLTQEQLAWVAGWHQQEVWAVEQQERRLDVIEFFHLTGLLGLSRVDAAAMLIGVLAPDVGKPVRRRKIRPNS